MTAPAVLSPLAPSEDGVRSLIRRHPIPDALEDIGPSPSGKAKMTYGYGTAGFRYPHAVLPPAVVRVGMFAAIRSASLGGEEVGIMITASHNPEADNGVKLADPDGGMLAADWEPRAVELVNTDAEDDAVAFIRKTCRDFGWINPFGGGSAPQGTAMCAVVHVGRDTRFHSPLLADLAIAGVRSLGAIAIDHGVVTTPQLHHFVMHSNAHRLPNVSPQRLDEGGYLETICGSYAALMRTASIGSDGDSLRTRRTLLVDCACGVGGLKVPLIQSTLKRLRLTGGVELDAVNLPGNGPLNEGCGAEFVQKNRLRPKIYGDHHSGAAKGGITYGASLDGDADRVVFHYDKQCSKSGMSFRLLDGDKIAALVTGFIQEELRYLQSAGIGIGIRCGIVQTAYANGASTSYLRDVVKTDVAVAKTGVKFVHAAAHDNFDIGVYFEANGHGTILFGKIFYDMISDAESKLRGAAGGEDRGNVAWRRLRALPGLVNQAVGDALSDLLLVDAVLYLRGWTIEKWDGLYEDMPSKQQKVRVKDRSLIMTNDDETRALSPPHLQPALDAAMLSLARNESVSEGMNPPPRCFVRPSGTEDAVRIYAEASTQDDASSLAAEAAALVHQICGGVGDLPTSARSRL
eukprot:CAMPEP_0183305548 /NCGR_PEP_ID=MMETSP0160_2-20130417/10246_1 /TAXON_ID=2839 ORGANISM="Odontella Sinensis, Strain Grunow 1884" /NCGR_SAMPLE_ID=MMETSP0160_2 /ASSEMBLY_ACC=CAM_ASM_000250 /LENGTH=630 /DNA_ID=CAMNT_0025468759 /DNA_START=44 /DNA_END=1936 /DNA_ORIENTATION=-